MKVTLQQTEKLLQENHSFKQLGFSMLMTRLKVMYAKDPSPEILQDSANEINAFIDKFKMIMMDDCAAISKL